MNKTKHVCRSHRELYYFRDLKYLNLKILNFKYFISLYIHIIYIRTKVMPANTHENIPKVIDYQTKHQHQTLEAFFWVAHQGSAEGPKQYMTLPLPLLLIPSRKAGSYYWKHHTLQTQGLEEYPGSDLLTEGQLSYIHKETSKLPIEKINQ